MSYENTINHIVNKEVKRCDLVKKRARDKGNALLLVQFEPILNRDKTKSDNFLVNESTDPFYRLRNFK